MKYANRNTSTCNIEIDLGVENSHGSGLVVEMSLLVLLELDAALMDVFLLFGGTVEWMVSLPI